MYFTWLYLSRVIGGGVKEAPFSVRARTCCSMCVLGTELPSNALEKLADS